MQSAPTGLQLEASLSGLSLAVDSLPWSSRISLVCVFNSRRNSIRGRGEHRTRLTALAGNYVFKIDVSRLWVSIAIMLNGTGTEQARRDLKVRSASDR